MAGDVVVVELRVHGVSGTPPQELLSSPTELIEEVAGDKAAGFYRRRPWVEKAIAAVPPDRGRRVLEAYSWGGLTSGPASRAVWLLFLPFLLVNLAHWMLPPVADRRRSAAVSVALLRLVALSMTLALMLAAAVAVLDVTVWQCAALDYCAAGLGPLAWLGSLPRGGQIALGALPLVVVIAVLWRLGREDTRSAIGTDRPPSSAVLAGEVPLESPSFWAADPSVLRLRACHVMGWTAGLAALVLAAPARYATGGAHGATVALLIADGAVLAVAVAVTASNRATARGGSSADRLTRPLLWLRWVSLALLAASLVFVALAEVAYPAAPTHFPGLRGAIYTLLAVQAVLLAGLVWFTGCCVGGRAWPVRLPLAALRRGRADRALRPSLGGFAAPALTVLGWLIGGIFSVGVGLWTAQMLGTAVLSTAAARAQVDDRATVIGDATATFGARLDAVDADAPLIVPPPYFWAALGLVAVIAVAIVTAIVVWWWAVRRRAPCELVSVLADHPGADPADRRARQVASARAWAALTDLGAPILAGLSLFAVLEIAVLFFWYLSDRGGFGSLPAYSPAVTNVSVFVTISVATGLVAIAVQAYRNRQLRRVVAVLWDVITFWPRANHPLTPPCYAERTVPELGDRLRTLLGESARIVVAAHSQGSVIAAATLLQAGTSRRVALLTFGSPLRRLYARNFPAYFGSGALARLRERQPGRWIDLWARSDPIGSWVLSEDGDVDDRILDVVGLMPGPDGGYPPTCGHSGFWTRPEFPTAADALEGRLMR